MSDCVLQTRRLQALERLYRTDPPCLVCVIMLIPNNTKTPDNTTDAGVEPHPDWIEARTKWKSAWPIHTYGLATFHLFLVFYAALVLVQLRRRLRYLPMVTATNVLAIILASFRMCVLFVDPYSSRHVLPGSLVLVMDGLTHPFIISLFTLVELNIMRITRVKLGPDRKQQTRLLACLSLGHFLVVLAIYVTVALYHSFKLLILLSQAIFITWGLVLCFVFVYNAFRIVQFTNETGKVLQQIVTYTRVKRQLNRDGNHRDLALHRIRKARIKKDINPDKSHYSEESHVTDGESSDSLCFFNEAHFELDEEKLEQLYANKLHVDQMPRPQIALDHTGTKSNRRRKKRFTHRSSNLQSKSCGQLSMRSSSESNSHMTDTPSTPGIISLEDQLVAQLQQQYLRDHLQTPAPKNRDGYYALHNSPSVTSHEQYCVNGSKLAFNTHSSIGYSSESFCHHNGARPTERIDRNGIRYDKIGHIADQLVDLKLSDEAVHESSGYMADTEYNSPKVKSKTSRRMSVSEEQDACDEPVSPAHCPYPLPIRDNSLGLYRIRQGQVLRKVLKVSYACTLFTFMCCVLQLYAMFGVYGVLSNETIAAPWSWYSFMTCSRLSELGLLWSSTWITHTIGRQRYRPARRNRRRALQISTSC